MCVTFYKKLACKYSNISMPWIKVLTATCPGCISKATTQKPNAGLRNIITNGFGVRGQVDLIDFQSMPDGNFRFLLNYIDHGIKLLSSDPIVAKRASCVTLVLYQIFCLFGAPSSVALHRPPSNNVRIKRGSKNRQKWLLPVPSAFSVDDF